MARPEDPNERTEANPRIPADETAESDYSKPAESDSGEETSGPDTQDSTESETPVPPRKETRARKNK